jgi:hypothetical protein
VVGQVTNTRSITEFWATRASRWPFSLACGLHSPLCACPYLLTCQAGFAAAHTMRPFTHTGFGLGHTCNADAEQRCRVRRHVIAPKIELPTFSCTLCHSSASPSAEERRGSDFVASSWQSREISGDRYSQA